MIPDSFRTSTGRTVPAVTAEEMREIDKVATEDIGLKLLQMMEHAGRTLAYHTHEMTDGSTIVVAGNGGNGGGGLVCARHLLNHDVTVDIVLDRPPEELTGVTAHQFGIVEAMDASVVVGAEAFGELTGSVVVDALIGYGLKGNVRNRARELIEAVNGSQSRTISLDVPSGVDATTGETLGAAVEPDRIVTLALPKTGLRTTEAELYLADLSIPHTAYDRMDIPYHSPFDRRGWAKLSRGELKTADH